jgi:pimeloyl-ACP methyl ester carboxylesterase
VTLSGSCTLSSPVVVYVHGFGSVRSGQKAVALEGECVRRGWTFAAADFRGHGDSVGSMLELRGSGLLRDLTVLRDWLKEQGWPQLFLIGSSMGGWASAWFAVNNPDSVVACVFLAPAFQFPRSRWDRLTDSEKERWWATGRLRVVNEFIDVEIGFGLVEEMEQYPVETLHDRWRKPCLIYHGMRDDTVPYQHSLRFVEKTQGDLAELLLLKVGDHRLTGEEQRIARHACDFFSRFV